MRRNEIFIANNVKGPEDKTVFADRIPTPLTRFSSGSISRLAILLTDTSSAWLGLAHGLKTIPHGFTHRELCTELSIENVTL